MNIKSLWLAALMLVPIAAQAQQASITLTNSDAGYCYKHQNVWDLTKVVSVPLPDHVYSGNVTYTVTATKNPTYLPAGPTSFDVVGGLTITNTGSAPAYIGNIVINLQKANSGKIGGKNVPWVSAAADIADATSGDASTLANIVGAGSQESQAFNAAFGANNYVASGAKGTFKETAGSGSLEFTNCDNDTIFSLVPQPVIPVGGSVTLLYKAGFSTSVITPGQSMRVEALVTFANSGARGGSGASANNIDVNGNLVLDPVEANVRTVPSRVTKAVASVPEECNGAVTVTDPGLLTLGDAAFSNVVGLDQFPASISSTTSWNVSADVVLGLNSLLRNTAYLDGDGDSIILGVLCDGLPVTFQCCEGIHLTANVDILGPTEVTPPTQYFSYTQGKFNSSASNPVAAYLSANFATLFPSGLTIGIADGAGPKHNATWTDVSKFRSWIGGGGPSGALAGDTLNATSTSGGTLAKQVGALTVNLALSGVMPGDPGGLGNVVLINTGTSLDGATIGQILDAANQALGGNGLPSGYTFGDLNTLIANLNLAYDDGVTSTWALTHLSG